ncbi:hypothetical protein BVAD3_36190 [Bacillus velezensis]|nr:hypothetical protein BVAD3_36190 [Bacillus velezensis]
MKRFSSKEEQYETEKESISANARDGDGNGYARIPAAARA